jgi:hypothetical protein
VPYVAETRTPIADGRVIRSADSPDSNRDHQCGGNFDEWVHELKARLRYPDHRDRSEVLQRDDEASGYGEAAATSATDEALQRELGTARLACDTNFVDGLEPHCALVDS